MPPIRARLDDNPETQQRPADESSPEAADQRGDGKDGQKYGVDAYQRMDEFNR